MTHFFKVIFVVTSNITLFLFTLFPMSLIVIPFNAGIRLKYTSWAWKLLSSCLYKSFQVDLVSIDQRDEKIRKLANPHGMYISNHQSIMDIPLILKFFQLPPIMKKSILYIPIFGLCAYAAGSIIVDRKNRYSRKEAYDKAIKRLNEFYRGLQFYPEGRRNREKDSPKNYEDIKKPLLQYAYANDIDVYAISICKNKNFFNKKEIIRFNKKVGIKFSDVISPKNYANEEEFMQAAWKNVTRGYFELEGKLNSLT